MKPRALRFQNVNPERGRKPAVAASLHDVGEIFQNVNPERGRKHARKAARAAVLDELFQNVNPERGRKLPRPDMTI